MNLSEEQIERYSRHIILPEVGGKGQEKLLVAKVLLVGAGGLGAPAGVGTIGVIDADVVDLTNLQRQVIHFTGDLGKPKVESAAAKMQAISPDVRVRTYHERLTEPERACDFIDQAYRKGFLIADDLPDAVVLDYVMPQMSGYQVLARIASELKKGCVVVFVTGHGDQLKNADFKQMGVAACLEKPVDVDELVSVLEARAV